MTTSHPRYMPSYFIRKIHLGESIRDLRRQLLFIPLLAALFLSGAPFTSAGDLDDIYKIPVKKENSGSSAPRVYKKSRANVVVIKCENGKTRWSGSGFAVKRDGLIITNAHVLRFQGMVPDTIVVTHSDWGKKQYKARIIKVAEDRDLALIKIEKTFPNPLKLSSRLSDVGVKVFALGNPGSGSRQIENGILELTFTEGIINDNNRKIKNNPCYQTTATINHGNSGGPLLDKNGHVVGINTFGLSHLENTFFAIRSSEIFDLFGAFINGLIDYTNINLHLQPNKPDPEKATLYAVVCADTNDPSIGASVAQDIEIMAKECKRISKATGMPLKMKILRGAKMNKMAVITEVSQMKVSPEDAVIFYFSGHGFRYKEKKSTWPYMSVKNEKGETAGLDEEWVYDTLLKKKPRFLLVLGDCCNNVLARRYFDVSVADKGLCGNTLENYKKLFLHAEGSVIASSSVPGEVSIALANGGFFTLNFIKQLHKIIEGPSSSWEELGEKMKKVYTYTNRRGVKQAQHPQAKVDITKGTKAIPLDKSYASFRVEGHPKIKLTPVYVQYNRFAKKHKWELKVKNGYGYPIRISVALSKSGASQSSLRWRRFTVSGHSAYSTPIIFLSAGDGSRVDVWWKKLKILNN